MKRLYRHSGPSVIEGSEVEKASLYMIILLLPLDLGLALFLFYLNILNIKFIIFPVSLLSGTLRYPVLNS